MFKNIYAFLLSMLIGVSMFGAPTLRTICLSGCGYTAIAPAEAVSLAGDILEIQDDRTYAETWLPSSERTLRNKLGNTPIVRAVGFGNAGVGPITILGQGDNTDFTFTNAATHPIGYAGTNNVVVVIDNVTLDCTKANNNTTNILGSGAINFTFKNCNILGTGKSGIVITNSNAGSTYSIRTNYIHDISDAGISFLGAAGSTLNINCNTIRNCSVGTGTGGAADIIKHNLYQDNTTDIGGTPTKANYTYNCFEQQTDTGGWGTGNLFATSITFTGISTAIPTGWQMAGDQANIDAGDTTGITPDIEGTTRPQNSNFDMGAYEYPSIISLPRGSLMMMGIGF